jgi:hypothetical protein
MRDKDLAVDEVPYRVAVMLVVLSLVVQRAGGMTRVEDIDVDMRNQGSRCVSIEFGASGSY